jgi:hypothetical protein
MQTKMQSPQKLVDGEQINLGGQQFTLPPLPLVKMPKIKALMSGSGDITEEFTDGFVNAVFWSLQRNYPDTKREFVEESIDMTNWQAVQQAFMKTNGFQAKAEGAPASGEAAGAATLQT